MNQQVGGIASVAHKHVQMPVTLKLIALFNERRLRATLGVTLSEEPPATAAPLRPWLAHPPFRLLAPGVG